MKFALATVALLVATSCASSARSDTSDPLIDELTMLAGSGATQCGLVPLGRDPTEAWACAQSADRANNPHWFAVQLQGIDSDVWMASGLTSSGQRFILTYDSNYMGGAGDQPRYTREICNGQVVLAPSRQRVLQCSRR